jgi:ubiquinone/menaquinone biosynthesis C-methylase UbiE
MMLMALKDTRSLYNAQADSWQRTKPMLLSDYSARPYVLDMCEPIKNTHVFDLGCGEGYVSRQLVHLGAASVLAMDISEKMIDTAQSMEASGITYQVGDARSMAGLNDNTFDLVLAMFLFNYLDVEESAQTVKEIYRILKPGGTFVMAVPHPSLPFLRKKEFPFYFEPDGDYFSGRNILFPGQIWRLDRVPVNVQCVHKTWEDYFNCFAASGFKCMPQVKELHINEEHVQLDSEFFRPLLGTPLHAAFKLVK